MASSYKFIYTPMSVYLLACLLRNRVLLHRPNQPQTQIDPPVSACARAHTHNIKGPHHRAQPPPQTLLSSWQQSSPASVFHVQTYLMHPEFRHCTPITGHNTSALLTSVNKINTSPVKSGHLIHFLQSFVTHPLPKGTHKLRGSGHLWTVTTGQCHLILIDTPGPSVTSIYVYHLIWLSQQSCETGAMIRIQREMQRK